ncbi:glaA [Symbiodinium sp. CCMP2592]|nr:glaA [Symbiodinium sp. CCMP2592]
MPVWVVFEVKCPTVNLEDVRIVGSLPELGSWESSRALPLVTSERTYPAWRTAEISLPSQVTEVVQYKYIKVFDGSLVQWEGGPNRILDVSCLVERMVNYVDDLTFDINDTVLDSGLNRIRFQFSRNLQSVTTSRFASSVPSPLRASQTPVEKHPNSLEDLENVLRELKELELMNLSSRPEIRRAIAAVRGAMEVERSGRLRFRRPITCAMLALLMVPVMPLLVTAALVSNNQSARLRYNSLLASATENVKRPLRRLLEPTEELRAWTVLPPGCRTRQGSRRAGGQMTQRCVPLRRRFE